jgi:hypothetical protein
MAPDPELTRKVFKLMHKKGITLKQAWSKVKRPKKKKEPKKVKKTKSKDKPKKKKAKK